MESPQSEDALKKLGRKKSPALLEFPHVGLLQISRLQHGSFTDGFWVHQEAFRVTEAAKATTFRANQLGLLKHETRSLRNAKDALASFRELNVPEGTLALCDKLESRQLQRLEEVCVKFPPCSGCKPGRRVQLTRGRQIRDCAKVRPRRCGPLLWPPWVWMHLGHCKLRTSL